MSPLVSVLIPVYNAERWLAEAIESVLSQTWKTVETIVVDDGSTDKSLDVARGFESAGLRVISQKNQGASAARNRAYRECQGNFIQYLDADDLLAPDKIEQQILLLARSEPESLASGEWGRFYNSLETATFVPESVWQTLSPLEWIVCSWEGGGMMHPAAWLLPRSIAEKAGEWDESLSVNDDGEYFCRAVLASNQVQFCEGARSYYRSGNAGSLSGVSSRAGKQSELKSLFLSTQCLLDKENSKRTRHACATQFQRFIYSTYPRHSDLIKRAEDEVRALDGSKLRPPGGSIFKAFTLIAGWKRAKKLQSFLRSSYINT